VSVARACARGHATDHGHRMHPASPSSSTSKPSGYVTTTACAAARMGFVMALDTGPAGGIRTPRSCIPEPLSIFYAILSTGRMKHSPFKILLQRGVFASSPAWKTIQSDIQKAVESVVWPVGAKDFTINPTKHGNGVNHMCAAFAIGLKAHNSKWEVQWSPPGGLAKKVGDFDVAYPVGQQHFVVEWETGNISSTHRSLNRIALGILQGSIVGGAVVLSSGLLYPYLTDRIGNFDEIHPYFDVYAKLSFADGLIGMLVVEHDHTDLKVALMPKGKSGMAKQYAAKVAAAAALKPPTP
jgi:hypothetical protein